MLTSVAEGQATLEDARPPLASQLFEERHLFHHFVARYPACKPLVFELREIVKGSGEDAPAIEELLRDYQERAHKKPFMQRILLALRFYLRDTLWACTDFMVSPSAVGGVTNHVGLVSRLLEWAASESERLCFVSFNYDTLLEQAVQDTVGFAPDNPHGYPRQPVPILKPHGSIDWVNPIKPPAPANTRTTDWRSSGNRILAELTSRVEDDSAHTRVSSYDELIDEETFQVWGSERNPEDDSSRIIWGVPALALPIVGKDHFVCPATHLDFIRGLRGDVDRILTVGWRAMEPHFLELLRPAVNGTGTLRILTVVGETAIRDEAASVLTRILAGLSNPHLDANYAVGGFDALWGSKELRSFLAPRP